MNIKDYAPLPKSGLFVLDIFRDGDLLEHYEDCNLIVSGAKLIQAHLLGGAAGYALTQIGFGTNGTAPADGNTALTGAYVKALGTVTYPLPNQVQYAFTLGTAEANGMAIMEFGLLTAGSLLYARKTRLAAIGKTAAISFSGSWTINF